MTAKKKRSKAGRPSTYQPEYAEQARRVCLLGATTQDLAMFFGVSDTTIENWMARYPLFIGAIKDGKDHADATVAASLYHRANGYSHPAVKIFADPKTGSEQIVPYVEHYAPDTVAAIFWLKNRQPKKWRDLKAVEHSGPEGGPIITQEWAFGSKKVEF